MAEGCIVILNQAARLKEISLERCANCVENGSPFDPFREFLADAKTA